VKIIGITGISGSGKTKVAAILAKIGGYVVDADLLAHSLMKKEGAAYDEIVATFGKDILDLNKEINRAALGKVVFGNRDKLHKLEGILHPKVIQETKELISDAKQSGKYKFAIIDAPLLIEAKMHKMCDSTWLITANHEIRLKRIMIRDNISIQNAEKRLSNRKGDEELMLHADIVIENNVNFDELNEKVVMHLYNVIKQYGNDTIA